MFAVVKQFLFVTKFLLSLNNLVHIMRSVTNCVYFISYVCPYAHFTDIPTVTNCVYFIPYVCPYAHFTNIPTRRGFAIFPKRGTVLLLVQLKRRTNDTLYENPTNCIVYSTKCPLQDRQPLFFGRYELRLRELLTLKQQNVDILQFCRP